MLSQIRQISDGNYNTVFVKNKEQKFNLDKEIHDLECWKQSRNHVYRKEERELLTHLDKLRLQQEYLHHLDEERGIHHRGVLQNAGHRGHHGSGSKDDSQVDVSVSLIGSGKIEVALSSKSQGTTEFSKQTQSPTIPNASLPPVRSFSDKKILHRTDAHTNICVVCQLPRRSSIRHGHSYMTEGMCCCNCEHDGTKEDPITRSREFSIGGHEEHGLRQASIQVGQRRHSLMMARLNDEKYEYKPHPPERGHGGNGRSNLHSVHGHHHHHRGHVHEHRGHVHEHHGHVHDHHGNKHDHHANQFDHHGRGYDNYSNIHSQRTHRHHHGNDIHNALGHSGTHPHHQHGYQTAETTHTPCNSPHRPSRHSLTQQGHYSPATSSYDPMYPGYHSHARVPEHHRTNQHHSEARRYTDARSQSQGGLRTGVQDHQNGDTRRRDHELHWDRHQVYKLRGMITDPHYKEQLELEGGKVYPWSSQYPSNKASDNDIENLKNCRYLRFSKLNLENMKENPEKEVEVFERRESPS